MADTVDKLKALLFQPESDAIATLSRRIDDVFDRAGTAERFQASVATVLDGALRDAEVARHHELSSAIAPLIVRTVKTEIHNSTDDLVEALYPATGRMVKAYVASAIKDLTDEINRRLEANPIMLRLNALLSGRSVGELAIAQSQRLKVEDVLLIRRATGELIARAPEGTPGSNSDHVLGGILTALNEFTTEAFKSEGSALRQIDFGDARVYLRVSPAYLLAAKCSGSAPVAAESIFDDEFLALIDRHHAALEKAASKTEPEPATKPLMADLAARLETKLDALAASRDAIPPGVRPLPVLAALILLPLAAWLAWSAVVSYRIARVQNAAAAVLAAETEMHGYPADIKVTDRGRTVTVAGLAPALAVKTGVIEKLRAGLPGVTVQDQLSPVPGGGGDVRPVIAAMRQDQTAFAQSLKTDALRRNALRAEVAIERTSRLLDEASRQGGPAAGRDIAGLRAEAASILHTLRGGLAATGLDAAVDRTRALGSLIERLASTSTEPGVPAAALPADESLAGADPGETLVVLAERAAAEAKAVVTLAAVRKHLDQDAARAKERDDLRSKELKDAREATARLEAKLAALPPPLPPATLTPRQELAAFARDHAVFFSEQTVYRDDRAASQALDDLARILAREKSSVIRVIGFTDDAGTPAKNVALAEARAQMVATALENRGVAKNRIVMLHKTGPETNVSPISGTGSPNRRVEFEAGFAGEGSP